MIRTLKHCTLVAVTGILLAVGGCRVGIPLTPEQQLNAPLIRAAANLYIAVESVSVYQTAVIQANEEGWLGLEVAQTLLSPMFEVNRDIIIADSIVRSLSLLNPPYDLTEVDQLLRDILDALVINTILPSTHQDVMLQLINEIRSSILLTQDLLEVL